MLRTTLTAAASLGSRSRTLRSPALPASIGSVVITPDVEILESEEGDADDLEPSVPVQINHPYAQVTFLAAVDHMGNPRGTTLHILVNNDPLSPPNFPHDNFGEPIPVHVGYSKAVDFRQTRRDGMTNPRPIYWVDW